MKIPPCANFTAGTCERSDTIVQSEKNNCFIIYCRTCKSFNVWPIDDRSERYNAFMKREQREGEKQRMWEARPLYSVPNLNPGTKGGTQ